MLELSKNQKLVQILTLIFLGIFPLTGLTFLHNHYTNLVIVILLSIIFILTLIFFKESRKNLKYIFLYYGLCLIYLGISWWKSGSFFSLVPNSYSIIKEALTIVKLVISGTFFYTLYYQKIAKDKFLKVAKLWIVLIAGSIIITNLFKISLSSYSDNLIRFNILEWVKKLYYLETASKGYFMYANQVASILLCLLVFSFYLVLEKKKNIFYTILICLAMLMLGTRVSSLGGLLSLILVFILYFILTWYQKLKVNHNCWFILSVILLWVLILPISPFMNRNIELNHENNAVVVDRKSEVSGSKNEQNAENIENKLSEKQQFVLNNYNPDYLPEVFFEKYYPMEYDEDFWYYFIKNNQMENINYRYVEKKIIERVLEKNNNKLDCLFGISNVRIQNIINVERDFLLHYYAFGIIGSSILLAFYFWIMVYAIYQFLKNKSFTNFLLLSCCGLFMFSAYLTGNIINSLFPTIGFAFIINCILVLKNSKKLDNN